MVMGTRTFEIHTPDFIDEFYKRIEINLGVKINGNAQELFDGLNSQSRAAAGEFVHFTQIIGGVDLAIIKAGNVYPHIARNRKHTGRVGYRIVWSPTSYCRYGKQVHWLPNHGNPDPSTGQSPGGNHPRLWRPGRQDD